MGAKRIFFLSSGQLVAHHWHSGRFSARYAFKADEDGLTEFAEYLQAAPPDPVSLLVDVVEEEFREETMPHVMGADRRALIRNKKTRLFRDSTYCHAIVQGRETEGRRDDKVLFTALIRPDLLAPWLGQMARMKVPLSGIYSLALLSELLLKQLKLGGTHTLLVTQHAAGGLRQSFFQNQQLKVSRLAVMPDIEASHDASFIMAEVEKIRRYLGSLRLLARDAPLDVHVISQKSILTDLQRQATDSITARHSFLDLLDVARQVGIKGMPDSPHADLLFAHLLAKRTPPNHYAPERETRYFSLQRARSAMFAASAVLMLSGLGWSGFKFIDVVGAKQETADVKRQTVFYTERLRLARAELPPAPALAHDVQIAVEIADTLRDYKASPLKMMIALSQRLERFPELHIDQIEWVASPDPNAVVGAQRGARAKPSASPVSPEESGNQYHVARVKGHLAPFDGDFREALNSVNRFSDAISELESVERVDALSLPFNASSEQRLLGTVGSSSQTKVAEFELRVVLKARDGEQAS